MVLLHTRYCIYNSKLLYFEYKKLKDIKMDYNIKIKDINGDETKTTVHVSMHVGEMINQVKRSFDGVKSIEIIL